MLRILVIQHLNDIVKFTERSAEAEEQPDTVGCIKIKNLSQVLDQAVLDCHGFLRDGNRGGTLAVHQKETAVTGGADALSAGIGSERTQEYVDGIRGIDADIFCIEHRRMSFCMEFPLHPEHGMFSAEQGEFLPCRIAATETDREIALLWKLLRHPAGGGSDDRHFRIRGIFFLLLLFPLLPAFRFFCLMFRITGDAVHSCDFGEYRRHVSSSF